MRWKVFTSKFFDERGARSCCALIFQAETLPVKVILLVPRNSVGHWTGFGYDADLATIMRSLFQTLILTLWLWLPVAWGQSAKQLATVLGSWQGESKCAIADSPCHDEQVLYQISPDRKDPERLNLDAYKIVDGSPDFMGTLACQYHAKQSALSCTGNTSKQDDWEFHIFGDAMSGSLKIEGGKMYRRIALHRAKDK